MALIFILLAILSATSSALKDLREIRYRFTPCGAVGRSGPTLSQCRSWYSERNSSIVTQNLLFGYSSGRIETFKGGQGFNVPKSGFYNITVAGGAGGRGICSYQQGLGLLWKGTIRLQDTQDLLVLVGQKGAEPCEVLKEVPVCKNVPKNVKESSLCFSDWETWLNNNPALSESDRSTAYILGGGGGGGGASMVRVHDRNTGIFHTLPSVVAGGGGGSAAQLSTDFLTELEISIPACPPVEASLDDCYTFLLNAKSADRDVSLLDVHNFTGTRGYIASSVDIFRDRAGAGGGYFPAVSLHQDGAALNCSDNFAVGGYDCLHLSMDVNRRPLIVSVHGGFGGGGGQCESGGSGGGYNGGSIFSNSFFGIPGNGGFSSHFSESTNTVSELSIDLNAELDGYVEIVPTQCGCGYKCIVYDDLQMFDCICPENFDLAPNAIDCFQGSNYNISDQEFWVYKGLTITMLYFEAYIGVFSVYATVEISVENSSTSNSTANAEIDDVFCVLLFLDSHGDVLLYSNIVRAISTSQCDVDPSYSGWQFLILIITRAGVINKLTPRTNGGVGANFLDKPYVVLAALLVSNHKCYIKSHVVQLNVSFLNMDESLWEMPDALKLEDVIAMSRILELVTPFVPEININNTETHGSSTVIKASISTSLLGFFLLIILVTSVVVVYKCHARMKHVPKMISPRRLNVYASSTKDGSLISNKMYMQQTPSNNVNVYDSPSSLSVIGSLVITVTDNSITDSNRNQSVTKSRIWEYSRRDLVYMKELGKGQFGKVLLMEANGIDDIGGQFPVAVKTLSSTDPVVVRKFTNEANLMKKLSHPNIVDILAVIFDDVDEDNAPLMLLEYMPYGDLQKFLRKHRPGVIGGESEIELHHFYDFARDVASGIAFLSSKKYVHRDIACRNCLVGHSMNIKLADFGMAEKLNKDGIYNAENNALMPVKWVSPESLLFGIFSIASDIWSYGVLLWEIVTYGEVPLSNISNSAIQVMAENKSLQHPRPPNCPDNIYYVMTRCHRQLPQDRITVEDILYQFSEEHIPEERVILVSNN